MNTERKYTLWTERRILVTPNFAACNELRRFKALSDSRCFSHVAAL